MTPVLHIGHVANQHPNLSGFCPFCQKEHVTRSGRRVSNKFSTHLKFCCFLHKVENSKYRQLFNRKIIDDKSRVKNMTKLISKTSVLTLQQLINTNHFLLNIIQYEIQTVVESNDPNNTNNKQLNDNSLQLSPVYEMAIQNIKLFHNEYILSEEKCPPWFKLYLDEMTSPIDILVAKNCLNFHRDENIDCMLIRIMSLHWKKFYSFRYTIRYNDFMNNIEKFRRHISNNYFTITRYMHLYTYGDLTLSMIIITPITDRKIFWSDLIQITSFRIQEINCIDFFIDTCLDLSCDNINHYKFPDNEKFQILNINYNCDVLSPPIAQRETLEMSSSSLIDLKKVGFNYFLSPLSYHARIYFYSQTSFGCIRAFDILLHKNNLTTLITDVVCENGELYLYYSSINVNSTDTCEIHFNENEEFATEQFYKQNELDLKDGQYKIFLINSNNIKIIVQKSQNVQNDECTIFPNCLFALNLKYKLTPTQTIIYKVVQYHREKLFLEYNNIPVFDNF